MTEMMFDRRGFIGTAGLAGAGLASAGMATPAWAKSKKRGVSASSPALQAVLDQWTLKKTVPGGVAMMAKGLDQADFLSAGRIAFGDGAAAMTPDTLFRAYSQTKPVTGMAAMLLIEEGKIGMDQNIADFIPGFANPRVMTEPETSLKSRPANGAITVRNLLTHTAGLGYAIITKGPLLKAYAELGINPALVSRMALPGQPKMATAPSLEEFANRLATLPLIGEPGRRWSYSVSLDLLGRVIEVASGMAFDEFLMQRFFKPLGMTSTYFQVPQSEIRRLTDNHVHIGGATIPIDPGKTSIYLDKPAFPFGGAGLVTSPRDWDRFALMLMGDGAIGRTRIMKPETVRWGMSNLLHSDVEMTGFAAGQGFGAGGRVTINRGSNGEGIGTFGWGGAASTIWWVDRVNNLRASGWIQLMQQGQIFPTDLAKAVYGAAKS